MYRYIRNCVLLFLLGLSGCGQGFVIVTATPNPTQPIDPTPTQEVWARSCLPDGVVPIHQGACPDDPTPPDIELVSRGNDNWDNAPTIRYEDGSYIITLASAAGFAGVRIHGLELISGRCYGVNLTGYSDLRDLSYFDAVSNYAVQAQVYKENGDIVRLPPQSLSAMENGKASLTGDRDFPWGLYSNDPAPTIVLEVGINAIWAIGRPGNHFRIDAVYVQLLEDSGQCAGVAGV